MAMSSAEFLAQLKSGLAPGGDGESESHLTNETQSVHVILRSVAELTKQFAAGLDAANSVLKAINDAPLGAEAAVRAIDSLAEGLAAKRATLVVFTRDGQSKETEDAE